jgi:hypothetical protein
VDLFKRLSGAIAAIATDGLIIVFIMAVLTRAVRTGFLGPLRLAGYKGETALGLNTSLTSVPAAPGPGGQNRSHA